MLADPDSHDAGGLSLSRAAELQDHLMMAAHDLDRLQTLLSDAANTLMSHFTDASQQVQQWLDSSTDPARGPALADGVVHHLGGAVTALQFQDMASQLINHTHQRLRNCIDTLALETFGAADEDGDAVTPAPQRPNPVTQAEMDAGSIELF